MTPDAFRALALALPEAEESAHMDHPDFRVANKIFATLGPAGQTWAMVRLTPEQQAEFMRAEPKVFESCAGAWGRGGATKVQLKVARKATVRQALLAAWRNTAPKRLLEAMKHE